MRCGLFFNFNGAAGAWRRACIVDAGGWTHDTLTEDLDLSYRAQLRGWRFVFDPSVAAPAELPADLQALKSQQRRWARGSVQTARKLLVPLLRSRLPAGVKLEAFVHLTGNFAYPLLLALGLLLLPFLIATRGASARLAGAFEVGTMLLGMVPATVFLAAGQIAAGARGWRLPRDVGAALALAAGLSWNNAVAVLQGLGPRLGDWERTPKTGEGACRPALVPYAAARRNGGQPEVGLAIYFAAVAAVAGGLGHLRPLPFLALMVIGLAAVGLGSRREPDGQSRTILGERFPCRALRVSTTARE
jgi:hypothetical protein